METRSYLFGLIKIERFGYRWGYTIPQIELMVVDCPLTVYPKNNKDKTPSKEDIEEATANWKAKYGGKPKGEKIDLSDLLSQFKKNKESV